MDLSFQWLVMAAMLTAIGYMSYIIFRHFINSDNNHPAMPAEKIAGLCYSPFREGQSPESTLYPSEAEIREDLALLSQYTDNIRIYSAQGILGTIPALAQEFNLNVMLGIWIGPDHSLNSIEIERAIHIANHAINVSALIVGNESIFRNDVSADQLINYINQVKSATSVPVSCSEQWHIWELYPVLGDHVDFVAAHVLPFWEAVPQRDVAEAGFTRLDLLEELFPDLPIVLTEVGWPSNGRRSNTVRTHQRQQSDYLRILVQRMKERRYPYYVIEAFDQPWKTEEGAVGAHWGLFSSDRKLKVNLQTPTPRSEILNRYARDLIHSPLIRGRGKVALPLMLLLYAAVIFWAAMASSRQLPSSIAYSVSLFVLISTSLNIFTELHEWLEAKWAPACRRLFLPVLAHDATRLKVSIHVPCYNEPPAMVIATLNALAALKYSNFEVLVIDNNTKDPNIWQPVARHCQLLGSTFKFFHLPKLDGYKSGALNFALQHTATDAAIIGVIDSDYRVDSNWLKTMTPHFINPAMAIVQCPQDYSDRRDNPFKRFCFSEYRGFFNIGMVIRNDHNSIIQHGTMTLIRRDVLDKLGWADWCICEDAELGLRVIQAGYLTAYTLQSCGQGLVPDNFTDFKKQRFRWAYGAVQILKRHKAAFWSDKKGLTPEQRYYFIAGWLPWINEGINLLFTFAALVWTLLMITLPEVRPAPPAILPLSVMVMFALKAAKTLDLYRRLVDVDFKDALAAVTAGAALYPTIGKAVLWGLFTHDLPFFRTPKNAASHGLLVAISEAREELFIMLLLWGAALGICLVQGLPSNDMRFWVAMLLVQSLPYLAALIMAFLSSLPKPAPAVAPATG
ncbi:glycosyltransferase [Pseudomonas huanghezhanensis]|uniref:glycosyltransferase n=1 Tax=Pseudomonas huanghezhanensis TaxID=3002903 RepID=UPI002285AE59|nr:glycosyltransferase [Pseudomonas sp. BSw22131]